MKTITKTLETKNTSLQNEVDRFKRVVADFEAKANHSPQVSGSTHRKQQSDNVHSSMASYCYGVRRATSTSNGPSPSSEMEQFDEETDQLDPFKHLYDKTYAEIIKGRDSDTITLNVDIFGDQNEVILDFDFANVLGICECKEVSIMSMVLYISYLHGKIVAKGKHYKFGFINSYSICDQNISVATSEILKRLQFACLLKQEIIFIPYKSGPQWILMIVKMDKLKVYWLDPLRRESIQYNLNSMMINVVRGLFFKWEE